MFLTTLPKYVLMEKNIFISNWLFVDSGYFTFEEYFIVIYFIIPFFEFLGISEK